MIKTVKQHLIQPVRQAMLLMLCTAILAGCSSDDETPDPGPEIVAGAVIDAEVGGPNQPNQVFIHFASKAQTAIPRSSWDLAFYSGDQFRVQLNLSNSALARAIDKTDLTEVTAADTVDFGEQLDIDAIFAALMMESPPAWLSQAASWTDDSSGDLTKTAIAEIATDEAANQVYIINRGKNPDDSQRGWKKMRILRKSNGYTLQHADIDAATFTEIDIEKDGSYNFSFVSFDEGNVAAEPEKNKWDIAFTTYTHVIPAGGGIFIPYSYKDYIIHNRNGVEVAQVLEEGDVNYDDFALADIGSIEFKQEINAIGSGWRTVAQPGSEQETDVQRDRFYVLKSADGNRYKFRFTRLVNAQTSERGFPQLEYELLDNE